MRDFSADHRWLSLNTATVRKQGDLVQIIDACARHGIRAIDPWRDQVAAVGLDRAARAVRDAGLELSGYCRGGMFTADAAHRIEARDDNRRAVDEAKALGAPCIVLVAGGLPQFSRPGSAASKDISQARNQVDDAIAEMMVYARDAKIALAIEPLHPNYAADRACVNTTGMQAPRYFSRPSRSAAQRRDSRRRARCLSHLVGSSSLLAQIARVWQRSPAGSFMPAYWLVPTRDSLNDRGMIAGDGVIDIKSVRSAVSRRRAGVCRLRGGGRDFLFQPMVERPMDEVLRGPASSGIGRSFRSLQSITNSGPD